MFCKSKIVIFLQSGSIFFLFNLLSLNVFCNQAVFKSYQVILKQTEFTEGSIKYFFRQSINYAKVNVFSDFCNVLYVLRLFVLHN